MNPAVAWGTLGAHVVAAKGARGACKGGGVSVYVVSSWDTQPGAPSWRAR